MKTGTVVTLLTSLHVTAWLQCSNTHIETVKKLGLGVLCVYVQNM